MCDEDVVGKEQQKQQCWPLDSIFHPLWLLLFSQSLGDLEDLIIFTGQKENNTRLPFDGAGSPAYVFASKFQFLCHTPLWSI